MPDDHKHPVFQRFAQTLAGYADAQDVDDLRARPMPSAPWPATTNPMMAYLVERVLYDLTNGVTVEEVAVWALATAWFEGGLDATAAIRNMGVRADRNSLRGDLQFFRVTFAERPEDHSYEGLAVEAGGEMWMFRHHDAAVGGFFTRSSNLWEEKADSGLPPMFMFQAIDRKQAKALAHRLLRAALAVPRVPYAVVLG